MSIVTVASLVIWFHDRFWYPPDDGLYAYVASRLLHGDVLNRDLQDIHAGYVHFVHAAALWLFGDDLLSLRYPLAVLTVIQSVIAYWLLVRAGAAIATAGAVAIGALSFIQFLNPSANWYALFWAVALIAVMTRAAPNGRRDVAVGILVAILFLFRQLSGVFAAMGALTWLLTQLPGHDATRPRLARVLLAVMGAGLCAYLVGKGSIIAAFLFGIWPVLVLVQAWFEVRASDHDVVVLIGRLSLGALIGAAPLIAYLSVHGTFGLWIEDAILAAVRLNSLIFFDAINYVYFPLIGIKVLIDTPDVTSAINLVYWAALLALPILAGCWFLTSARHDREAAWHPLPVMALFYGLVGVHFQTPYYLAHAIGPILLAVLWLGARRPRMPRILPVGIFALSAVAVAFHAGQPYSLHLAGMIAGKTAPLDAVSGLDHAHVAMESADARLYRRLLGFIAERTRPEDTILAIPVNPEIYYLSGRRPPFRFVSTAFGLRSDADTAHALEVVERARPALVIHNRTDKYNSPQTLTFMDGIRKRYRLVEKIEHFDLYAPIPTGTR